MRMGYAVHLEELLNGLVEVLDRRARIPLWNKYYSFLSVL